MGMKTRMAFTVAVMEQPGEIRFVTSQDYHKRVALWEKGKPAITMPHEHAKDIAMGLRMNGFTAFVVEYPSGMNMENPGEAEKEETLYEQVIEQARAKPSQTKDDAVILFCTQESRKELIEKLKDSQTLYVGTNEEGETIHLSATNDGMYVRTYQSNGWVRVNHYDKEGVMDEETYCNRDEKSH